MQTFEDWFNTKNFPDREALANLAKISNTPPPPKKKLIYITYLTLKKLYHPIRQMGMILNHLIIGCCWCFWMCYFSYRFIIMRLLYALSNFIVSLEWGFFHCTLTCNLKLINSSLIRLINMNLKIHTW